MIFPESFPIFYSISLVVSIAVAIFYGDSILLIKTSLNHFILLHQSLYLAQDTAEKLL